MEKRPDRAVRKSANHRPGFHMSWSRRLAAAGLAVLLLLPLGVIVANAQDAPLESRYLMQPGDSIDSVAIESGLEPTTIVAVSTGVTSRID
jgi:hypothetical protein